MKTKAKTHQSTSKEYVCLPTENICFILLFRVFHTVYVELPFFSGVQEALRNLQYKSV